MVNIFILMKSIFYLINLLEFIQCLIRCMISMLKRHLVDPIKLKSFFTYVNTPLENAIATWFNDFDFSELTNPADSSLGNYVYESFDSNVDSIGRLPTH